MSGDIVYSDAGRYGEDVLQSPLPVILDFYSEDCPPCEALAPMYERLAERYRGRMRFVKIYRQENRKLAESLGVLSSPTILFFKDGKEVGRRLNGFIKKPDLRKAIEGVLGEPSEQRPKERISCDLIILGGGPAGLTAALYAARSKLNVRLIDQGLPGGQAANTYHIANYPGTDGVIRGSELTAKMLDQARSFGAIIDDFKEVFSVNLGESEKVVETEDTVYTAPALIIATGATPRRLPAEGADSWQGRGVHYCATCDGAMYEGSKVIVVGGGNSAVEEAVFLTRFADSVTIVHEFDHFQATPTARDEALANPKIDVVWECHVIRVLGDDHVTGVTVKNLKTGETRDIPADGIFVYIGTQPDTSLFEGQLRITKGGYIETDAETRTAIPGVFAAGDVREKGVRQVATAVGDGAAAAVWAERYISSLKTVQAKK